MSKEYWIQCEENDIADKVISGAIEVHKIFGGPGLLESVYQAALIQELKLRGMDIKTEVPVPVIYKGYQVKDSLFLDLLVDNKVIIEIKAVEKIHDIYKAQLLTYLRMTGHKLGLIINFGDKLVKDGTSRVVNNL